MDLLTQKSQTKLTQQVTNMDNDLKRISSYAEQTPWPEGSVLDRAHDSSRRPTLSEERDEHQSKLLSKYGQDAIDSHAEQLARHKEDLRANHV